MKSSIKENKLTAEKMRSNYLELLKVSYIKDGVLIIPRGIVESTNYYNGSFATCPVCGQPTANNACGYSSCLFGCGLNFKAGK